MLNIFYTLIIFPLEQIIELTFVFIFKIFKNPGLSVLGVSLTVSILILPLYFMAEKHQRSEQDIKKKMKPKLIKIKAVFSGDERFMLLSTYYRQNGYHPLYALRSSFSLLIQIPFFIAAYHFLSTLRMIQGVSFGPIMDLAKPDSLLTVKGFSINILPILMTLINCLSAVIYSKGFSKTEKTQLYGMAAVFLILLYNSPSGLVLYWTGNNVFSLIKNIIQRTKLLNFKTYEQKKLIILVFISIICLFLDYYLLIIHKSMLMKRLICVFVITIIPLIFVFLKKEQDKPITEVNLKSNTQIFLLSISILFLLIGLVIPSSLIASSVQEFSFIGNYKSPFLFISNTLLQSFGLLIILPLSIYFLFSQSIKKKMALFAAVSVCIAMVNAFLFPGNYGFISIIFTFLQSIKSGILNNFLNLSVISIGIIIILLLFYKFKKILISGLIIIICDFLIFGLFNIVKIDKDFKSFDVQLASEKKINDELVYRFSTTGKNVLVIMLDRAISGYVPYIFEEKPELLNSFDGFIWYKNTVSFGGNTYFGMPGIFGGYEYTPLEMQKRKDNLLVKKNNEALLMLPRIFLENGFYVTVTDPPWANYSIIPDLSIFNDYPQINAKNIIGKYINKWILKNNSIEIINTSNIIETKLIRFSFFKIAPLFLRDFIYDDGKWLSVSDNENEFPKVTLNNYSTLDVLPDITKIDNTGINTYNVLSSELTHAPFFLQVPDYTPSNNITFKGNGPFSDQTFYHVNMASLILVGKWFDFLKENNVYDNTRIIIVSDHGWPFDIKFPDSIELPNTNNGHDENNLEAFAALLLVKDFNSHGLLSRNNTFMTNADVPILALKEIVKNPINPWTGKLLESDKENGIIITTAYIMPMDKKAYINKILADNWLHVKEDIFNPKNWTKAEVNK